MLFILALWSFERTLFTVAQVEKAVFFLYNHHKIAFIPTRF
jgi:hypothetical protein